MGHKFEELFWSAIGQLVMAAVVGVAVVIWGVFQGADQWFAVIGGILTIAAVLWIIKQSGLWEPPIRIKVRQWLDDLSYGVRDVQNQNTEFSYEVRDLQDLRFYVFQNKINMPSVIVLVSGLNFQDPKLKELNEKEHALLVARIRRNLNMMTIGYQGLTPPLGEIKLDCTLTAKGLHQEYFFEKINLLRHAIHTINAEIGVFFQEVGK